MSLHVVDSGLDARLVDVGRPRSRHRGVPLGGAADRACFQLANALVGNPLDAVALEFAVKGPILRAEADTACAIVGAPFAIHASSRAVSPNASFTLPEGEELIVTGCPAGMRAYLAVAGGFDAPLVLDSRSALTPLRAGDRLTCPPNTIPTRRLAETCPFLAMPNERTLRVLPGPQSDWFDNRYFENPYVVHRASNRMGVRLDGEPLIPAREMVSEPVCPGCVQITRDGLPILLGVDGQTIGGYPKIAVIIDADLDILAQLRPGSRVRFAPVDLDDARRAWSDRQSSLREWFTRIKVRQSL